MNKNRRDNMNSTGSSSDFAKILDAIANQRWFFFKNNDAILFDANTALIWANLDYFPYQKDDGKEYSRSNFYKEVRDLIAKKNVGNWGGFNDWRIPTYKELWNMICNKTFPFQKGNHWRINDKYSWCIIWNGNLAGKDLDDFGADRDISDSRMVNVLPCSSKLVPNHFSGTAQEILNIFKANGLIPIFDDDEINKLYNEMLIKPPQNKKSVSSLDCQTILDKYDVEAVDKSAIRYYEAVLSVVDELLATLPENDTSKAVADKKRKLSFVKDQAESFFQRLDEINTGYDSIRELAKLESEPRTSFAFLVESLTRIIKN
ncbi:MAG: hypothetical protein IJG33_07370 [Selenomonadaceae bacterium]|nr:hypothetical protein [Selenomonadaceae bacterium]